MRNKLTLTASAVFLICLTHCSLFNNEPTRPDIPGKLVFHTLERGSTPSTRMFTMNANGDNLRSLKNIWAVRGLDATWTDKGDSILFNSNHVATTLGPSMFKSSSTGKNPYFFGMIEDNQVPKPGWRPKQVNQHIYAINAFGGWRPVVLYEYSILEGTERNVINLENEFRMGSFAINSENDSEIFCLIKQHPNTKALVKVGLNDVLVDTLLVTDQQIGGLVVSPDGGYLSFLKRNSSETSLHLFDVLKKDEVPFDLGLHQAEMIQWNNSGTHIIVFGRRRPGLPDRYLYYYAFNQGSPTLLDSLSNEYINRGERFDWYAD